MKKNVLFEIYIDIQKAQYYNLHYDKVFLCEVLNEKYFKICLHTYGSEFLTKNINFLSVQDTESRHLYYESVRAEDNMSIFTGVDWGWHRQYTDNRWPNL